MSLSTYFKETQAEIKHVSWPTRRQAIAYTLIVIAISIVVGIYLGVLDGVFSTLLKLVLAK